MRVLIVEDEARLAESLQRGLREAGYAVDVAADGEEGAALAESAPYDALISDVMLPKLDGLSLTRRLRGRGFDAPILLLTARSLVEDRVAGLDAGADDYLVKPFAFPELLARLRALLRRDARARTTVLRVADLELDPARRSATRAGRPIALTGREYALLEYLVRNAGQVLTRSQIADHVWDYDFDAESNVVDVYIRYLRRKVDDGFEPKLIQTVRGVGYRLAAPDDD